MRWPFHFGKAAGAESAAASEPAAPTRRRDWESLAPIQRAVGDAPLTAASLEFSQALAGSEAPPLSLEKLGHHRSPDGPDGLVIGLADPIATYAPSTPLKVAPRRRAETPVSVQARGNDFDSAEVAGPVAATDEEPVGDLLTRVLPAAAGEAPFAPSAVSRLTDASRVEVGPLRPVQRPTEPAAQARPTEVPGPPAGNPPPTTGTRLNLGLSRRRGLGAPIRTGEAAAVEPAAATTGLAPAPAPALSAAAVSPEPPPADEPLRPEPLRSLSDEDASTPSADDQSRAPLPPARRQTGGSGHSAESPAVVGQATEPPGEETPAATLAQVPAPPGAGQAPHVPARPIAIQRLATSEPSLPRLHESRLAPTTRSTSTVPLTPFRPPMTSVRLPGGAPVGSAPETASPRSHAAVSEMPLPAIQRSPALAWTPLGAASATSFPQVSRLPEFSPLVWNVQRLSPAETPGAAPAGGGPSAGEGPSPGAPVMASAPAAAPAAAAAPSPGGAPAGGPQAGEAPAAVGGAGGPGGAAPAGGAAPQGEKELYELAQSLFDPLMSLLRREVLTERERAGFVTDLR